MISAIVWGLVLLAALYGGMRWRRRVWQRRQAAEDEAWQHEIDRRVRERYNANRHARREQKKPE